MLPENRGNWYRVDEMAEALGIGRRKAEELAAAVPEQAVQIEASGIGRPRKLYHFSAHPLLTIYHERGRCHALTGAATGEGSEPWGDHVLTPAATGTAAASGDAPAGPAAVPVSEADLARGRMRADVARLYELYLRRVSWQEACHLVIDQVKRQPFRETIAVEERLDGGHRRRVEKVVELSGISERSIQRWHAVYAEHRASGMDAVIAALARGEKQAGKRRGRKAAEIPADLLSFVYAMATSSPRGDVAKAVELAGILQEARHHWPQSNWPDVSLQTWRRRILGLDPRDLGHDLNHSVSRFRAKHSPDAETNWDALPLNGLWEIDDVQEDWYGVASDEQSALRPYAYAIIRVRTREWIALVTSETPITQEQVRTLIGCALASPRGGIPDAMKFERGTVAGDEHLFGLLRSLGVRVSQTSMDGGHVHAQAAPDRGTGHFQGKAVIEANLRLHHELQALQNGQIGTNERETGPSRIKRLAERFSTEGKFFRFPRATEWHGIILGAMQRHNGRPHGGHPEILDTATGEKRHMTPAEVCKSLAAEPLRVMSQNLLPLFYARGRNVPVNRNGIRVSNHTYGRFDEELKALRTVTVYQSSDEPEVCYCQELGRCLELYAKADPGSAEQREQFGRKRHLEKRLRNQREEHIQAAIAAGATQLIEAVTVTENPTPERATTIVEPAALRAPAEGIAAGRRGAAEAREELAARTRFDGRRNGKTEAGTLRRGRSLLSVARRMEGALTVGVGKESLASELPK